MSKPRPIHHPHRELRTSPDEAEPLFSSYEDSPYLGDDVADDFHNRLAKSRRESSGTHSGGSFWRTTENTSSSAAHERGPSFSSVHMKGKEPSSARKSSGLLAQALQSHSGSDTDRMGNVSENPTVRLQRTL